MHVVVNYEGGRMASRLQLTWHWSGLTPSVRRLIKSCEVCKAAKHKGTKTAGGKRRLYIGQLWQKVSVKLVWSFSVTPRRNKWALVLTYHFT